MLFDELFKIFSRSKSTKDVARDRLKLVLVHDRAGVSPQFLDKVKNEIIKVISDYMDIDKRELDIQLTSTKNDSGDGVVPALVANIPIRKVKNIKQFDKIPNANAKEKIKSG
ncbi:MAG: cell division topological specificity factor MinE [Clostridiales bacterium]